MNRCRGERFKKGQASMNRCRGEQFKKAHISMNQPHGDSMVQERCKLIHGAWGFRRKVCIGKMHWCENKHEMGPIAVPISKACR